jgi:ABC-2 type transport system permease protein
VDNLKRSLALYFRLLGIQVRSQMQYRLSFWMDIASTFILEVVYFFSFAVLISQYGGLAGWSLGEIAFLMGMAQIGFGLMDMFFSGFDPDALSPMIRQGKLDQVLLRPVNISLQIMGMRFVVRRVGRVLEGLGVFIFALTQLDLSWTISKVVYFPVVILSQVIGMGALFIAGATLTIWTHQPVEAINTLTYGGNEVMSFPMGIYPLWMRRFFMFVVPIVFLNYYPALYFLDKPDFLGLPGWVSFCAPLAATIMIFLALKFWEFGLRHYQSTGT